MPFEPLVSVVMPIFNAEAFLQEAIESVLAQSYQRWELLLVDDGSSDTSPQIARAYASQHSDRIVCLNHADYQNRGKSTTRNLGIQQAHGDYLTFLDADDLFLPDKLANQVALLNCNPEAGMVYGRTQYWYKWPGAAQTRHRNHLSTLGVIPNRLYMPPLLLEKFLRDTAIVPCICSFIVRRSLVLQLGFFDESIQHLYEDQVLIAKLCLATPIYVEAGCGERYRQHADSSSNQARRTGAYHPWLPDPARLQFLLWLQSYLVEQSIHNERLEKELQRALAPYHHRRLGVLTQPFKHLLAHASRGPNELLTMARERLSFSVQDKR